jgi:nucleoside-diphosphate-sugar epimerase
VTRIAVTGGSGKAGRAVVQDLVAHGHEVLNIDQAPSPESSSPESPIPFLRADVTDFGQALEALSGGGTLPGIEAVVHLAAIPSPAHATPDHHDVREPQADDRHVVMKRPSRELMAEVFPGVPVADHVDGTDTLLDITKARRVLGYAPEFSWRQILT